MAASPTRTPAERCRRRTGESHAHEVEDVLAGDGSGVVPDVEACRLKRLPERTPDSMGNRHHMRRLGFVDLPDVSQMCPRSDEHVSRRCRRLAPESHGSFIGVNDLLSLLTAHDGTERAAGRHF